MPDSTLASLTAATAATGGLFYGTQSGADRKFTITAPGASLMEATTAAIQRTALGMEIGTNVQAQGSILDKLQAATWVNGMIPVYTTAGPGGFIAFSGTPAILGANTFNALQQFSGTTHAGLRLNNLTTTERDAIASPAAGMTVWNTTTTRLNLYDGSAWTSGFVRLVGDTMTGALVISTGSDVATNLKIMNATGATPRVQMGTLATSTTYGAVYLGSVTPGATNYAIIGDGSGNTYLNATAIRFSAGGTEHSNISATQFNLLASQPVAWNSNLFLVPRAASSAWLGMGAASATPIEQVFAGCDGSGSNITGGILNISAGRGTGTGIAGVLNFRSHAAAASSSTVNVTPVNVLSIIRPGVIRITGIPTSSAGLSTGDVYSNAGILTIV